MLTKYVAQMNPKTIKAIKVGAVVVGAVTGAVVIGIVLYKFGLITNGTEVVEEVIEAAQAA